MHLRLPRAIKNGSKLVGEFDLDNKDNDVTSLVISSRKNYFDGTNHCWKNLINNETMMTLLFQRLEHVKSISFLNLWLDDWEPLLQILQQQCTTNLFKLEFEACHLTERGARLLGTMLATTTTTSNNDHSDNQTGANSGGKFEIKSLKVQSPKGSTAWMDGLFQNKTITNLFLQGAPILHAAIHFVLNAPQLKKVELIYLTNNGEQSLQQQEKERSVADETSLETLIILFHRGENFPLSFCQNIGNILRQAKRLNELCLYHVKQDLLYNFLKDAIYCNKLVLGGDFDPQSVSALVPRRQHPETTTTTESTTLTRHAATTGNVKHLALMDEIDESKVAILFDLIDLSWLDKLEMGGSVSPNVLYSHLVRNKGPKHLSIRTFADLNDFATRLASSLRGNDKIESLEIHPSPTFVFPNVDNSGPQQQLVNVILSQMPKLQSWKLGNFGILDEQDIELWKAWILPHVQSNWNIHDICLPFELGDEITEMLLFNKRWRRFLRCHDELSSGVWPPALSHVTTIGLMSRILQEVPSLFQQVADTAAAAACQAKEEN